MRIFSFGKKVFVLGLTVLLNFANALDCILMRNQECKIRPEIISINSNNPIFYPFSDKINKCNGNCNNISDPYARICVSDVLKNLNVKEFNLISRNNKTRSIKSHETSKCICRLNEIICNDKQRWNKDKCRCECKELIDKEVCDKGFIWNPSNCECESNKFCNISQYLDYSDCKCKKKLIDPLIEECTENDNEAKLVNITVECTENDNETKIVKYEEIWNVIKHKLNIKFHSQPIYENKYLKAKVREFKGNIKTNFLDNSLLKENTYYFCIACITVDFVIKMNQKKECKYKIKKINTPT